MKQISQEHQSFLKQIGLTKQAIALYEVLLRHDSLSAQEAARTLQIFPTAVYRLFYELEERQLVQLVPGKPRRYRSLALSDGLQASLAHIEQQLESLLDQSSFDGSASIIVGRQKVYDAYIRFAEQASSQLCVYAIGIAYSKELAKTQADAVRRGVIIKHVVQEVKAANYYVISRWQQLGIELRLLKRPRGYHIVVIDDRCAIVTFSNPKDTEQRISLLTTDPSTVALLQAQFDSIWQHARPLNRHN